MNDGLETGVVPDTEASFPLDAPSPESAFVLGEAVSGNGPGRGVSVGTVFRMVLVLALTALAVYGMVFFLRRAGRPRDHHNPHLKILSTVHLGSNRFVYVISVGAQAWLVGAGEGGLSPIAEITDQEAMDAMVLDESRRNAEAAPGRFADFRALLRRFGGDRAGGVSPGETDNGGRSLDNLRRRRERLKGL